MTRRLPLRAPHKPAAEAARSNTGGSEGRSITRSASSARQQLPRTAGLDARTLRLGGRDDQKVAVARWQAHRMLKALSMAFRNTMDICTQAAKRASTAVNQHWCNGPPPHRQRPQPPQPAQRSFKPALKKLSFAEESLVLRSHQNP